MWHTDGLTCALTVKVVRLYSLTSVCPSIQCLCDIDIMQPKNSNVMHTHATGTILNALVGKSNSVKIPGSKYTLWENILNRRSGRRSCVISVTLPGTEMMYIAES